MLYPLNAICLGIFWQFIFFYFILITFRGIYKGGTFLKYDINFRHLEYFIKVARLGSINKAAQALYISQPYLGKIMHNLEENLGARLFNRSRSGVTLTPEGMEFLTHSEKIIDEMEQLWFQKKKEQIKISDPLAVSMTRFSHIMESFSEIVLRHRDQPSFSHRLYEGNSDEVIEDVVSGRVDVGVFHFDSRKRREMEALLESKGLEYHFLANIEPHIIISRKHPLLLQQKPVNLHTLAEYGFLWYLGQCDDYIYQLLSEGDQDAEKMRSKITYLSSRATLMYMISISDCYSIGTHDFAKQEASYHSTSIPIPNCGFMLEFWICMRKDTPMTAIVQEFIYDLKKKLL